MNSSVVDVEEYARRLGKTADSEDDQSKSVPVKTVAQRTRSKAVASTVKASCSVQSLSSASSDSFKLEHGLEVSSDRIFAKGIRKFSSILSFLVLSLCFSLVLLIFLEPFYIVVEFKPPVLKPVGSSSKELFGKRSREGKPREIESLKSPLYLATELSPDHKRPRPSSNDATVKPMSLASMSPVADDTELKASNFVHMLDESLSSQHAEVPDNVVDGIVDIKLSMYVSYSLSNYLALYFSFLFLILVWFS